MAERKKTTKKASNPQPINDVAAPGQTAPSATSTPVIITNHAVISDPMMLKPAPNKLQPAVSTKATAPLLGTPSKLQPLKAPVPEMFDVDAAQPAAAKPTLTTKAKIIKSSKKVVSKPVEQVSAEPKTAEATDAKSAISHGVKLQPLKATASTKPEPLSPALSETSAEPSKPADAKPAPEVIQPPKTVEPAPSPVVLKPTQPLNSDVVVQTNPEKLNVTNANNESTKAGRADTERDQEVAEEHQKEQAAKLQKLVEEKTYFLPIDSIEKRRTKRFVVLGIAVSLLLIVAWADIALDAGLIQLGNVKSATHFFNETSQPLSQSAAQPRAKVTPKAATTTLSDGSCAPYTVTDTNFDKSPFTGCFDQHFTVCSPAQITVTINASLGKGEIDKYAIQSKQASSCLVQWQYVNQPSNPKLNGLTMTCPYDLTKEFQAAFAAKSDTSNCSGPLVTALTATSSSSN